MSKYHTMHSLNGELKHCFKNQILDMCEEFVMQIELQDKLE